MCWFVYCTSVETEITSFLQKLIFWHIVVYDNFLHWFKWVELTCCTQLLRQQDIFASVRKIDQNMIFIKMSQHSFKKKQTCFEIETN